MPVILRFQSTGTVPGNARPVAMVGPSLTIGRGDENDLVLPDPDKLISKRHCVIEDHGGNIIVIDLSTNGTYLNYGKTALGRVATPLNNGDILTMGTYELAVEISSARPAQFGGADLAPLDLGPVSHGRADAAADLGSLLDDRGPGGGVDFLDALLGAAPPSGPAMVKRPELGDDGLLPPLDIHDLMAPSPLAQDPGPAQKDKGAAMEDHFQLPRTVSTAPAIPDDWDDLIAPTPAASPLAAPPAAIPIDDDLFAPITAPAPPLPAVDLPATADAFAPPAAPGWAGIPEPEAADADLVQTPTPEQVLDLPEPPLPKVDPFLDDFDHVTAPDPIPADQAPPPYVPPAPPPPTPVGPEMASDQAARAFLAALGADRLPITDDELEATLNRMGSVLRMMITGMRELLMTRTSIKSEFRINQTMISAGGNNPLKFSISPEQAIEAMVKPTTRGYLDAVAAAEQALNDIKAHEIAMMTGMEAALKGILKRLDPAVLAGKIETGGGIGSILMGKKARYWEVYEKMYAEISDQAENDFHDLFAREFARAYQDQLERLK